MQTRLCLAGCYGAGADKTRQQEEPQTLQLYEELKGTWKRHTLEAAAFFFLAHENQPTILYVESVCLPPPPMLPV